METPEEVIKDAKAASRRISYGNLTENQIVLADSIYDSIIGQPLEDLQQRKQEYSPTNLGLMGKVLHNLNPIKQARFAAYQRAVFDLEIEEKDRQIIQDQLEKFASFGDSTRPAFAIS